MKLLGKIRNIPLIVVGKNPNHKNILIAFDGTREIIKAVKALSCLIETRGCKLLLCHSQHKREMFEKTEKKGSAGESDEMFALPMNYFLEAGFSSDQVSFEIIASGKTPTHGILNTARYGNYGTIIVGRRGLAPWKRLMVNRVGNKIFKNADNHVVWIVQ